MYITYVDDAGDPGLKTSPTDYFVLAATLVHEKEWLSALDGLVALRSRLYRRYGISTRARIRARDFARGAGPFRDLKLSPRSRGRILEGIFKYQAQQLPIRVFAVSVHKEGAQNRGWAPAQAAWTFLFQRLQRFVDQKEDRIMVLSEPKLLEQSQKLVRHMRRHHRIPFHRGPGDRRVDIRSVVEDPLRANEDGFWLQLADWNAHAALRSVHVDPLGPQTQHLWDLLAHLRIEEVSRLRGGPPGIVQYP